MKPWGKKPQEELVAQLPYKLVELSLMSAIASVRDRCIDPTNEAGRSINSYCFELRTIRIQLPRQSGITTAAVKIATTHYEHPWYVGITSGVTTHIKNKAKELDCSEHIKIYTLSAAKNQQIFTGLQHPPSCVIVEPVSLVKSSALAGLYECFYRFAIEDPKFLFIFLG